MRRLLLLAVLAALALAACGEEGEEASDAGGEETTGAAAGITKAADRLCREFSVETRRLRDEIGPALEPAVAIELAEALLAEARETLEQLGELEPEAGASEPYERYLQLFGERSAGLEERIEALQEEDPAALRSAQQRDRRLDRRAREAAAEADLTVCAGRLPDDVVAEIEETIEQGATSNDPELICEQLSTERFIEVQFGGKARCEAIQRNAPDPPDSVEIEDLNGTDGVEAQAEISLREGGTASGEALITLVYEDGTWKVDALAPTRAPSEGESSQVT